MTAGISLRCWVCVSASAVVEKVVLRAEDLGDLYTAACCFF